MEVLYCDGCGVRVGTEESPNLATAKNNPKITDAKLKLADGFYAEVFLGWMEPHKGAICIECGKKIVEQAFASIPR